MKLKLLEVANKIENSMIFVIFYQDIIDFQVKNVPTIFWKPGKCYTFFSYRDKAIDSLESIFCVRHLYRIPYRTVEADFRFSYFFMDFLLSFVKVHVILHDFHEIS